MLTLSQQQAPSKFKVVLVNSVFNEILTEFTAVLINEIKAQKGLDATAETTGSDSDWVITLTVHGAGGGSPKRDLLHAWASGPDKIVPWGKQATTFKFDLAVSDSEIREDFYTEMVRDHFPEILQKHQVRLFSVKLV